MSKQYNKGEKRKRRLAYLKRKRSALKSKSGGASTPNQTATPAA